MKKVVNLLSPGPSEATTATPISPIPPDRGVIEKPRAGWSVAPNLIDYDETCATFDWNLARRRELDGLPGGQGVNIAYEAIDRHVSTRGGKVALRCVGKRGTVRDLTYAQLAEDSG